MLTAVDLTNRSLASWFDNVNQPETNDGAHTARFLREFFEFLMEQPQHPVVDLRAGDVALQRTINDVGGLQAALEENLGLVSAYFLTPRPDDLGILQTIERTGFQPKATLLILNTGRADQNRRYGEQFAMVTRHSVFRAAVDRGTQVVWMPALDSTVRDEVEVRQRIMQESRSHYDGRCVCQYQTKDSHGRSCKGRHDVMGSTDPAGMMEAADQIAGQLRQERIDAVLLSPV
jgi:hypothetical protein